MVACATLFDVTHKMLSHVVGLVAWSLLSVGYSLLSVGLTKELWESRGGEDDVFMCSTTPTNNDDLS
jgi:hypothetical protein